jgi:hypothetical protein
VENGMKASSHQVHGKRSDGEKVGVVLHVGGEPGASVIRPVGRLSWKAGQAEREGGLALARFASAKRTDLAVLGGTAFTVGLRRAVLGVTCLASMRPVAPKLAVTTSVELAGHWGFSPGQVVVGNLPPPEHVEVDEGGIYSW